jgi:hypothetical protein
MAIYMPWRYKQAHRNSQGDVCKETNFGYGKNSTDFFKATLEGSLFLDLYCRLLFLGGPDWLYPVLKKRLELIRLNPYLHSNLHNILER